MTNIVGQKKLLAHLAKYDSIQSLPKTLIFIGPEGCGKHTLTKYLAEKFNLNYKEINETVSNIELEDYLYSTLDTLYVINLSNFSEKQQNQFLKFIEEPSKSTYVVLIATSECGVLNTILNRCIKYTWEPYSKEEIEQITGTTVNELAFKIFKTPGKLLNLTNTSFQNIISLVDELLKNIDKSLYANSLVISTKLNYKDFYNKVDVSLFLDAVEYFAFENYKKMSTERDFKIFMITNQFKQYNTKANLLKEALILNYLTTLWEVLHDTSRA